MNDIKVSVIVPIYNVEEFLEECLDSLVHQTLKHIEVLMVDDGSTDNSAAIARKHEKEYSNFHYIYKENGGLGSARNFGVNYAKGEFLVFLDSDDIIPNDAYEKMYNLAIETDVDIVCGNMKRLSSKGIYDSSLHKKVYKSDIKKTHISEYKNLIYDTTSTNKMYKTDFYKKYDFKFPEGIYYEDIPMVIPSLWKAKSVSVLTDTCYLWRTREGENKSITQKRTTIKNFMDRVKVMDMVDAFYEENVSDVDCINMKDYKWLDTDLMLFINQMDMTSEEYNAVAIKEIKRFYNKIGDHISNSLSQLDKLKYEFICHNDIENLKKILSFHKSKKDYQVKIENGKYYIDLPFLKNDSKVDITKELEKREMIHKVLNVEEKNNQLVVDAYIRLPRMKKQKGSQMHAYVFNQELDLRIPVQIKNSILSYDKYRRLPGGRKKILLGIVNQFYYTIKLDLRDSTYSQIIKDGFIIELEYSDGILKKSCYLSQLAKLDSNIKLKSNNMNMTKRNEGFVFKALSDKK